VFLFLNLERKKFMLIFTENEVKAYQEAKKHCNLFKDKEYIGVIDFKDCSISWYLDSLDINNQKLPDCIKYYKADEKNKYTWFRSEDINLHDIKMNIWSGYIRETYEKFLEYAKKNKPNAYEIIKNSYERFGIISEIFGHIRKEKLGNNCNSYEIITMSIDEAIDLLVNCYKESIDSRTKIRIKELPEYIINYEVLPIKDYVHVEILFADKYSQNLKELYKDNKNEIINIVKRAFILEHKRSAQDKYAPLNFYRLGAVYRTGKSTIRFAFELKTKEVNI